MYADATGEFTSTGIAWVVDGLSAGTHTFAVVGKTSGGGGALSMDTARTRTFQVIEILAADATLIADVRCRNENLTCPATYGVITGDRDWDDPVTPTTINLRHSFTPTTGALYLIIGSPAHTYAGQTDSSEWRFAINNGGGLAREGPCGGGDNNGSNEASNNSLIYAKTGLSAVSSTIEMQWKYTKATPGLSGSRTTTFQIIEITANFALSSTSELTSSDSSDGSWNDMLGMSQTVTPDSTDSVMLYWSCGRPNMGNDDAAELKLARGGTRKGADLYNFSDDTNRAHGWCAIFAEDGLSSNEAYSLQWTTGGSSGGALSTDEGSERVRMLQVLDLKAGTTTHTPTGTPPSVVMVTPNGTAAKQAAKTATGVPHSIVMLAGAAVGIKTPTGVPPSVVMVTPGAVGIKTPTGVPHTVVMVTPGAVGIKTPTGVPPVVVMVTPDGTAVISGGVPFTPTGLPPIVTMLAGTATGVKTPTGLPPVVLVITPDGTAVIAGFTTLEGTFMDFPTIRLRTGGDSHRVLTPARTAEQDATQAEFMAKERGKVIHLVFYNHRAGAPFSIQAVLALMEQKGVNKRGDA
jgi:hypothetical protein